MPPGGSQGACGRGAGPCGERACGTRCRWGPGEKHSPEPAAAAGVGTRGSCEEPVSGPPCGTRFRHRCRLPRCHPGLWDLPPQGHPRPCVRAAVRTAGTHSSSPVPGAALRPHHCVQFLAAGTPHRCWERVSQRPGRRHRSSGPLGASDVPTTF